MADHIPVLMVLVDASDGRILYANPTARRAACGGDGELIGTPVARAFAFVDLTRLDRAARSATANDAVADHRDGQTTWWDLSYSPLPAAAPEPARVLVTGVNVSHHHRLRADAEAARDTLEALLAYIPQGISISRGPEVRVERISAWGMGLIGRHPDEVVGRSALEQSDVWEVHRPDGTGPLSPLERPLARATRTGEVVLNENLTLRSAAGGTISLLCHSGPIRDAEGRVTGALMAWQDTSELQRAQAAVRARDERLRAVLQQIPAAIVVVEPPDGRVAFKSAIVDDLLGHPAYDLSIARITQLGWALREDGSPYELSEYPSRRALFTGETIRGEPMRYRRGDGRLIDLEMHAGPVRDERGNIVAAVSVALDVTERRVAEARLRDSEQRLQLVIDATRLGIWEYDPVTGAMVHSARHDEILGYPTPQREWSVERFTSHFPAPDRTQIEAGIREALVRGAEFATECRMIRADGTRGWIKVCARPHTAGREGPTHLLGSIADITEHKEAEAAAVETAAKFELLAQTMPCMVWTSLPDGEIEWFNHRVSEYSGLDQTRLTPDGWSPVHPDDVEESVRLWREAIATGTPYTSEYRIRRRDGVYRWHITRAVPLRDASGQISRWIGSSADIEDQKNTERALVDQNSTLEQQVRQRTAELLLAEAALRQSQKMEAIGQLTGGLAHDFNNLLNGITGSLELMAIRLDQGRVSDLDRYLQVAQDAAKRAAALTHRLLAFARRQTLDPKPTDINHLVDGMGDLIRRTVGPAVAVTVLAAPSLWRVLADPNQLESALLNLCINARDAMPDGGRLTIQTANRVLEEPAARELELPAGEYVSLGVFDTGGGMTPEVIERAFDPFFTTKPIGAGTGLGLSMVYGFVRQSGGQARIQSAPGRGTEVLLFLPRHVGGEGAVETPVATPEAVCGGGETVVVVDDEASVRTLIADVLEERGYTILQADHGARGLELLQSAARVDLLVTDVGLPGGMNGRQLADAARSTRPDLKVLFITGYAEHTVLGARTLQPHMHVLTKPFALDALAARVKSILAED